MSDCLRVFAGECTTTFDGPSHSEQCGEMVVLRKPDDTVLVHDRDGYQPVAWLTRADSVKITATDGITLTAATDREYLRVRCPDPDGDARHSVSAAGVPVGDCPDCDGSLVRADGRVTCLGCDAAYAIPRQATVRAVTCDCGLPQMRTERGAVFDVCIDRDCEPLDDAVAERFDGEWPCPNCESDLTVQRRGTLLAGCERHPDCDTGFAIPSGITVGTCDCGLPVFDTATGTRCLDATCDAPQAL